ncbi:MAG: hypothetical protein MJ252_14185 [archaeon]|nr:hypothetical protein [archaeon]
MVPLLDKNEIISFGDVPTDLNLPFALSKVVDGNASVRKIVCGIGHCLILLNNGQLFGFGGNDNGQLGIKITDEKQKLIQTLTKIQFEVKEPSLNRFIIKDIAAGDDYSLILIRQEEHDYIIRFGLALKDRYRINIKEANNITVDPIPEDIGEVEGIFAFGKRRLLVTQNNKIYINGADFKNFYLDKYTEVKFEGEIQSLHLGMNHCLIFGKDGFIYGIGDNTYGELGNIPSTPTEFTKLNLNLPGKIKQISSGARHILFLLDNGDLYVLGDNSEGQGTTYSVRLAEPTKIEFDCDEKVTECFCGSTHNVVVMNNGDVYAWGDAYGGKLGHDEVYFSLPTPRLVLRLRQKKVCKVGLGSQMTVIATGRS